MDNQYVLMLMGLVNALTPLNIVTMAASVTMGIIMAVCRDYLLPWGWHCCSR